MLQNKFKYWALIIAFNYGSAALPHLLLRPFWFHLTGDETNLTGLETIFTAGILPIALLLGNYWFNRRSGPWYFFFLFFLIMCSCILLSERLHLLNWIDSTRNRYQLDPETLAVGRFELVLGITMTAIGSAVALFKLYKVNQQIPKS
jgi:hypothetical protein